MKPGKVSLGISDDFPTLVSVVQDTDCLYGKLQTSSLDKQYSVVFCDGYIDDQKNNARKWIAGKTCLIKNDEDTLLWIKDVERPINAAVSDTGTTALLHTTYREPSKTLPRQFVDLGGTLAVIGLSGNEIFANEFGSNIHACAISPEGKLVSVATLAPDNSVYCFHALEKRLVWKYKNRSKNMVLGLAFNGTQIDVFTGKTLAKMEKEYALSLTDGSLTPEYQKELEPVKKHQPSQQKAEALIARLGTANDTRDVMNALEELKSFVSTKGSIAHYGIILNALGDRLQEEKEVFNAVWKVLRVIMKKKPEMVDPYIPEILALLRGRSGEEVEGVLIMLGELGSANPAWVKDEQPFIMEKLVESKVWNERRYAALAMGSIGSSEPSFAKDAIPIMIGYVAHPKEVARELGNLAKTDPKVSIDLGVTASMGADPAVWLQDACIDALGMIGEKSPESVGGAIALLESVAKEDNSPYTRTKAAHALDRIRRKR